MNTTNSTQSTDALSQYRYENNNATPKKNELGRNEFMELMIAQLENQSPLDPQDNGAFISQLAEFSALEEMQNVSKSVDSFATQYRSTQALQASAMVGRRVLVPSTEAPLNASGKIEGVVELPASTSRLKISVLNKSGELVNSYDLGQQRGGSMPFEWDGKNTAGQQMPVDSYTIKAEAYYGGKPEQVNTLMSSNVNSVSISKTGAVTLNLQGMGAIPMENVREIN